MGTCITVLIVLLLLKLISVSLFNVLILQASENSNALLIGVTNGTGRSSLIRLASHMARCKLYAPQMTRDREENRLRLRHQMKKASKTAGLIGRPAVLLVKDSIGEECMQDVCCLVQEGMLSYHACILLVLMMHILLMVLDLA